jgi:hypothetical protein
MNKADKILMTDEKRKIFAKCVLHTNLAYLCSDVAQSNLMLAEQYLDKLDKMIPRDEIIQLMSAKSSIKMAMKEVTSVIQPMYECLSADTLCEDSDWIHEILTTVMERTNYNPYAQADILEYIKKYKRKIKTTEKKK